MSKREESKKRLVEFLWAEINRAILKSPDVRSSVKSLQALDLLDYVSDYNLVLDVKTLVQLITKDDEDGSLTSTGDSDQLSSEDMVPKMFESSEGKSEAAQSSAGENHEVLGGEGSTVLPREEEAQRIDGKPLSESEMRFQKHLEEQFDENEWMKRAGIRFPGE